MSECPGQLDRGWRETVIIIRPRPLLAPTTIEITGAQDAACNEPGHLEFGAGIPWASFTVRGSHVPASSDEAFELFLTWCDEVATVEYSPLMGTGTVSFVDSLPVTVGEILELGRSPVNRIVDGQQDPIEMPAELAIEESEHVPS